jgi:hypothetical protein
MIIFTVMLDVRDELAAALNAHVDDRRLQGAVGRIKRAEHPLTTAGVVRVWPADADGRCRIALSDVAGTLAWRAMAIADMVAGREASNDLAARLGVSTQDAFAYIEKYTSDIRERWPRLIRRGPDEGGHQWTFATKAILAGRRIPIPDGGMDNIARYDKNLRRRTYALLTRAGLTLPPAVEVDGLYFRPRASSLFQTPTPAAMPVTFSAEDEEAIRLLAT